MINLAEVRYDPANAAIWLPTFVEEYKAALDEIERLQAREQQLKLDVNRVHNETMTYKAAYGKQAACIQYLEDADGSNPPWEATEERIDGLLATMLDVVVVKPWKTKSRKYNLICLKHSSAEVGSMPGN